MSRTFQRLLDYKRLEPVPADAAEVRQLLAQARRSLADGRKVIKADVSVEWQYMIVYGAALALAGVVVRASGYRAKVEGHHATLFEALPHLLPERKADARFFYQARRRRHHLMYGKVQSVTAEQVRRMQARAERLDASVRRWLKQNHPNLLPPANP